MCIICIKPSGVKLPKDKVIKRMFAGNSNGAGFMYRRAVGKDVVIDKGYFDVMEFIKAVRGKVMLKDAVVLHFRLATHGAVDAGNCHPFPAVRDVEQMRETSMRVDIGVAHNGIFSMPDDKLYSDSMLWIASRFADDSISKNLHRSAVQHLINDSLGSSRLAVMTKDAKHVLMFGKWEHDTQSGLYYSNDGYKEMRSQYWGFKRSETYPSLYGGYEGCETGYNTFGNGSRISASHGEECEGCGRWCEDSDLVDYEQVLLCPSCLPVYKRGDLQTMGAP